MGLRAHALSLRAWARKGAGLLVQPILVHMIAASDVPTQLLSLLVLLTRARSRYHAGGFMGRPYLLPGPI